MKYLGLIMQFDTDDFGNRRLVKRRLLRAACLWWFPACFLCVSVIVCVMMFTAPCLADEYAGQLSANPLAEAAIIQPGVVYELRDSEGNSHGKIGVSRFDPDSVDNEFGRYGSKFSPDSIHNEFGIGSEFHPESPSNRFGNGLQVFEED